MSTSPQCKFKPTEETLFRKPITAPTVILEVTGIRSDCIQNSFIYQNGKRASNFDAISFFLLSRGREKTPSSSLIHLLYCGSLPTTRWVDMVSWGGGGKRLTASKTWLTWELKYPAALLPVCPVSCTCETKSHILFCLYYLSLNQICGG